MSRKNRSQARDLDLEAQVVAWLRSQAKSEKAIGAILGVSQPEVARLKRRAEAKGWLQTQCLIPAEAGLAIQRRFFSHERVVQNMRRLAWQDGVHPPREVRIFDSGGDMTDPQRYQQRLEMFGRAAAGRIGELLPFMRLVGVTWGRTIWSVLQGLKRLLPDTKQRAHKIKFIPVSGLLLDDPENELSSTRLAASLHSLLSREPTRPLSLGAVPARIPPRQLFTKPDALEAIREFVQAAAGYRNVFVGRDALINQVDSFLTSVGSNYKRSDDPWLDEMSRVEGIDRAKLNALTIGDIGGMFLRRPFLAPPERALIQEMNARWTGVRLEHLQHCAQGAASSGRPGVIILAVGKEKADIVRECVRRGLVNELIIDHTLAKELAR